MATSTFGRASLHGVRRMVLLFMILFQSLNQKQQLQKKRQAALVGFSTWQGTGHNGQRSHVTTAGQEHCVAKMGEL